MFIDLEIIKFKNRCNSKGTYAVYVKDNKDFITCTGIYFISCDEVDKAKYKKITAKPKRKANISFIGTIVI